MMWGTGEGEKGETRRSFVRQRVLPSGEEGVTRDAEPTAAEPVRGRLVDKRQSNICAVRAAQERERNGESRKGGSDSCEGDEREGNLSKMISMGGDELQREIFFRRKGGEVGDYQRLPIAERLTCRAQGRGKGGKERGGWRRRSCRRTGKAKKGQNGRNRVSAMSPRKCTGGQEEERKSP